MGKVHREGGKTATHTYTRCPSVCTIFLVGRGGGNRKLEYFCANAKSPFFNNPITTGFSFRDAFHYQSFIVRTYEIE